MKRKPIEMIKNKNTPLIKMEDELSTLVQFQENIMAQIIDRKDEAYADFLVNQIIAFMDENNVSTCFVLNKEELLDCLKEHNKLHCEILNLQSQLDQANERLKDVIVPKFKVGQECYYVYTKSQLRPFNIKIGRITFDTGRKNKFLYDSDFEDDDSYFEKYYGMKECDLFTTKEEAQAKLKEIQGE